MAKEKLPAISGKKLIKVLYKMGLMPVRQSGSHAQIRGVYKGAARFTTVPVHGKENLPTGTLKGILDDCNITNEEFFKLLKKK